MLLQLTATGRCSADTSVPKHKGKLFIMLSLLQHCIWGTIVQEHLAPQPEGLVVTWWLHSVSSGPSSHAHSAAQRSTAQHSAAQHSTAQRSAAQHSTAQHSTAQHSTAHQPCAGHSRQGRLTFVSGRNWPFRGAPFCSCECLATCLCSTCAAAAADDLRMDTSGSSR